MYIIGKVSINHIKQAVEWISKNETIYKCMGLVVVIFNESIDETCKKVYYISIE